MIPELTACFILAISDGDTLRADCNHGTTLKVRLAEIDAPELSQNYGQESRLSLDNICPRRSDITIQPVTVDRYHRIVARVTCNGIDASLEQATRGMAWFYPAYGRDQAIKDRQLQAEKDRTGLWQDKSPIPPWIYRRH